MKNRFELSSIFSTNGVSENANQVFGRKYLKLLHLMCYLCVRTSVTHVPGLYTCEEKGEKLPSPEASGEAPGLRRELSRTGKFKQRWQTT